jgi:hypothetical protein
MNPLDALVKSLGVEQSVALLFAAACFFGAGVLGFAVQLNFLRPVAGQFIPVCGVAGLIGVSHGLLAIRLQGVVKTLAASSKAPAAPASVQ